ncbi:MAG: acetoin utilization protein AcuB [Salibacteraceae bacterium]|jgi:predicted transcriptional regulator
MTAGELAELELPYLETVDSCDKAMGFMDEFKLSHYPVVNEGVFEGLVYESDIYELDDWSVSLTNSKLRLPAISITHTAHFLTVVNKLEISKLSCLPVVGSNNSFKGVITRNRIVAVFGESSIVSEAGGVIEIELLPSDYYLTDITRIIENTGQKILGTYIRNNPEDTKIVLTVKLNKPEVEAVLSSLDRFGYTVLASYQSKSENDDMQNRYDNLMNFLNI